MTSCVRRPPPSTKFRELKDLLQKHEPLGAVFLARRDATAALLCNAVREGQLDALKWLQALCHSFCIGNLPLMEETAERSHLSILKQLRSGPHPARWGPDVAVKAAPHIDCLL